MKDGPRALSLFERACADKDDWACGRLADLYLDGKGITHDPGKGAGLLLRSCDAKDGWAFTEQLAREGGALVSPGDFYGSGGANNVRVAVVQPDDRIEP